MYPDDRAKPELLCALTRFDALCGIRPVGATLTLLGALGADRLAHAIRSPASVPRSRRSTGVGSILVRRSSPAPQQRPEAELVTTLAARYPDDPSTIVTLLLNRVTLQPGEALHLTAGNLHAYLSGAGVELMGASDNVVRGGLTVKHVDVDELLRILDPTPLTSRSWSTPGRIGRYPLPEAGCTLVRVEPGRTHTSTGHELTVGLDGRTFYLPPGSTLTPTFPTFVVTT